MGKEGTLPQIPLIKGSKRAAFLPGEKNRNTQKSVQSQQNGCFDHCSMQYSQVGSALWRNTEGVSSNAQSEVLLQGSTQATCYYISLSEYSFELMGLFPKAVTRS